MGSKQLGGVKAIVTSYIDNHKATIKRPKPKPIVFSTDSDTTGFQTVCKIGPFLMQAQCQANGVAVQFTGPGAVLGTNSLGATDGGAGSSYETP